MVCSAACQSAELTQADTVLFHMHRLYSIMRARLLKMVTKLIVYKHQCYLLLPY